jgi:hypothetical protein
MPKLAACAGALANPNDPRATPSEVASPKIILLFMLLLLK